MSQRHQFGKPLAAFQQMLSDIIGMQLLCLRLAHLQDEGKADLSMASLAKLHTAAAARRVLAEARDLLGGNGLLLDNHVARAPRRHRSRLHLRRHRQHPVTHRRPRHHRPRRLHLSAALHTRGFTSRISVRADGTSS